MKICRNLITEGFILILVYIPGKLKGTCYLYITNITQSTLKTLKETKALKKYKTSRT